MIDRNVHFGVCGIQRELKASSLIPGKCVLSGDKAVPHAILFPSESID